jgi:hypothetical protein
LALAAPGRQQPRQPTGQQVQTRYLAASLLLAEDMAAGRLQLAAQEIMAVQAVLAAVVVEVQTHHLAAREIHRVLPHRKETMALI